MVSRMFDCLAQCMQSCNVCHVKRLISVLQLEDTAVTKMLVNTITLCGLTRHLSCQHMFSAGQMTGLLSLHAASHLHCTAVFSRYER